MKNNVIVSIVICTYNNGKSLSLTLDQLLNQEEYLGCNYEFLILTIILRTKPIEFANNSLQNQ